MTKKETLENLASCFNKAKDDEEIFVLRSTDRFAPTIVREWARTVRNNNGSEEKVVAALAVANRMDAYGKLHGAKIPD